MTASSHDRATSRSGATRAVASLVMIAVSLGVGGGISELALRFKNSSMETYDIEMWRYARTSRSAATTRISTSIT